MAHPNMASNSLMNPEVHEYRGKCPVCNSEDSFMLNYCNGRPIAGCANCRENAAVKVPVQGKGVSTTPLVNTKTYNASPICNADQQKSQMKAMEVAKKIWTSAKPAIGTLADDYLTKQGLIGQAYSPVLRFHPNLRHPTGIYLPALVALVTDPENTPSGIYRMYLSKDGSTADVEPAKASLGPVKGGAIRLDQMFNGCCDIVVGKGLESTASAGRMLALVAWATISHGNLEQTLILPPTIENVHIAVDADEAGEKAAVGAAERWTAEGRRVWIYRPEQPYRDFSDIQRARVGGK